MLIRITTGDPRPIFKQIVDEVSRKIRAGELPPGEKLPSVRALAAELTINVNTIAKAYTELTGLGLIKARKGLGLFVSEPRQQYSSEEQNKRLVAAADAFVADVMLLDFSEEEFREAVRDALKRAGHPAASRTGEKK